MLDDERAAATHRQLDQANGRLAVVGVGSLEERAVIGFCIARETEQAAQLSRAGRHVAHEVDRPTPHTRDALRFGQLVVAAHQLGVGTRQLFRALRERGLRMSARGDIRERGEAADRAAVVVDERAAPDLHANRPVAAADLHVVDVRRLTRERSHDRYVARRIRLVGSRDERLVGVDLVIGEPSGGRTEKRQGRRVGVHGRAGLVEDEYPDRKSVEDLEDLLIAHRERLSTAV